MKNNTPPPSSLMGLCIASSMEFDIPCNIFISNTQYIWSKCIPQLSVVVIKGVLVFNNVFQWPWTCYIHLQNGKCTQASNWCSINVTGNTNHKPTGYFMRYTCRQSMLKTSDLTDVQYPWFDVTIFTPDQNVWCLRVPLKMFVWLNTVWTLYTVSCKNIHG